MAIEEVAQCADSLANESVSMAGQIEEMTSAIASADMSTSTLNLCVTQMNDDFNTPVAISELLRFVKIAPKFIELNDSEIMAQLNFIVKMFEDVLGFDFKCDTMNVSNISNEQKLIELISSVRDKLRIAKNYELSDFIRNELNRLDISISDKKI